VGFANRLATIIVFEMMAVRPSRFSLLCRDSVGVAKKGSALNAGRSSSFVGCVRMFDSFPPFPTWSAAAKAMSPSHRIASTAGEEPKHVGSMPGIIVQLIQLKETAHTVLARGRDSHIVFPVPTGSVISTSSNQGISTSPNSQSIEPALGLH